MIASSVSPNYQDHEAFGELETALRRQIKDTLESLESGYDKIDVRVQTVEQRLPKNLRFRLKTIEDHVKTQEGINDVQPHDARASVPEVTALAAKVKSLESDVHTFLTTKLSAIQSEVDDYKRNLERLNKKNTTLQNSDPVVQDLVQRLHKLEKQDKKRASLDTWSSDDLARELLQRLKNGQSLSPDLAAEIHRSTKTTSTCEDKIETSGPRPRKRPAPNSSSISTSTLSEVSSAEELVFEAPASNRVKATATATDPAPSTRSSPRRISSMWKATKAAAEMSASQPITDTEMTEKELEMLLQDEPRRSGRAPKPARNPQYLTWLEVAAAKRRKSSF
ncbi:hypothetical protein Slin15195_G011480 [Septoria linicola]|uniref:Uncharacterized protein n=1 Tax=Septoria linicola TaxID=215465 RepID=A0A9Q9AHK0_9PEZI|nr:hypothetical protein Slin14017_G011490 [Septoria linicola]USW47829.1 hypothetical protein Slin15195_G011480 [Septoria linicola]